MLRHGRCPILPRVGLLSRGLHTAPIYRGKVSARPRRSVLTTSLFGKGSTESPKTTTTDPKFEKLPRVEPRNQTNQKNQNKETVSAPKAKGSDKKSPPHLKTNSHFNPFLAPGQQHYVTNGDTLWSVAVKYSISVQTLKELNGIKAPSDMKMGMPLVLKSKEVASRNASKLPDQIFAGIAASGWVMGSLAIAFFLAAVSGLFQIRQKQKAKQDAKLAANARRMRAQKTYWASILAHDRGGKHMVGTERPKVEEDGEYVVYKFSDNPEEETNTEPESFSKLVSELNTMAQLVSFWRSTRVSLMQESLIVPKGGRISPDTIPGESPYT